MPAAERILPENDWILQHLNNNTLFIVFSHYYYYNYCNYVANLNKVIHQGAYRYLHMPLKTLPSCFTIRWQLMAMASVAYTDMVRQV